MKYLQQLFSCLSLAVIPVGFSMPVLAATQIDINSETNSFRNQKIQSGAVEVVVNYRQAILGGNDRGDNLSYKIFYNGRMQVKASTSTTVFAEIFLQDLDGDRQPEVIIKTFSGGAHCCTNHTIYSWQNKQFVTEETGFLNSDGGEFIDLDGDGSLEFVTSDNSFLYAFSSYAGSYPPSLIYRFNRGKLENVTRLYLKEIGERATKMYEAFLESKDGGERNGILAGYVAQKILLGEYKQAWQFMLENYDPKSDTGLDIYQEDKKIGEYADFPAALKAFLINTGYLDDHGQPYPLNIED
jgi:hypothetical protein